MPICDGFGSTALIRGMSDIVQPWICALTANAMEGDAAQCIAKGMNYYLSKPLFIQALTKVLTLAHLHTQVGRRVQPSSHEGISPAGCTSTPPASAPPP
jgi:CheY-like chemotaxis protein